MGGVTSAEVKIYETSNLVDITCVSCTQGSTATATGILVENAAGTANLNALGAGISTTGAVNTTTYRFNTNSTAVCK